jgi:hypothetical protein
VVEENVVRAVVMDDVDRVVGEAMVDGPAETDDFTVGITDAKGTPLQGVVPASGGRNRKPSLGKKRWLKATK